MQFKGIAMYHVKKTGYGDEANILKAKAERSESIPLGKTQWAGGQRKHILL